MMDRKPIKGIFKYIGAGLAGMAATIIVQPLDLVKTRMQLSDIRHDPYKKPKTTLETLTKIYNDEGLRGIYKGLDAALLRQATYTTTRLGVYTQLNDLHSEKFRRPQMFWESLGIGFIAGGCGALVGTPADLALVRLTADGRLPEDKRRNYTGVINALARVVKEEGFFAIWKGCVPTIGRAMVVNSAQLTAYTQIKLKLLELPTFHDGLLLQFCASMLSGFVTTLASIPVDMAKTRIQNQLPDPLGNLPYRGSIHVFATVVREEGLLALWKGFVPYFARLGPHTVLTFIFLEQLTVAYNTFLNQ